VVNIYKHAFIFVTTRGSNQGPFNSKFQVGHSDHYNLWINPQLKCHQHTQTMDNVKLTFSTFPDPQRFSVQSPSVLSLWKSHSTSDLDLAPADITKTFFAAPITCRLAWFCSGCFVTNIIYVFKLLKNRQIFNYFTNYFTQLFGTKNLNGSGFLTGFLSIQHPTMPNTIKKESLS